MGGSGDVGGHRRGETVSPHHVRVNSMTSRQLKLNKELNQKQENQPWPGPNDGPFRHPHRHPRAPDARHASTSTRTGLSACLEV